MDIDRKYVPYIVISEVILLELGWSYIPVTMPPAAASWTTAQLVEKFAGHGLLERYTKAVRDGEINGSDLSEMDEEAVAEMFNISSKVVVKKVTAAIHTLIGASTPVTGQKDAREEIKTGLSEPMAEGPTSALR